MPTAQARTFVLDCTLRDGGFYTDWDFPMELADAYVAAMDAAGVAVIEVGYRSRRSAGYAGPFKYVSDPLVRRLAGSFEIGVAVMLDAKEFVGAETEVGPLFAPADASRITMVRVATTAKHVDSAAELVAVLSDLGYRTTINLMAWGSLDRDECRRVLDRAGLSAADVIYVADSFGAMHPDDVVEAAGLMGAIGDKAWGIHLHNNLELAFANALAAVRHGATWVDTSVLGMGRGPGNLKTELWLQHLATRAGDDRYQTGAVYDLIGEHLRPMQDAHGWGPGPAYVLSGNLGVHPSFAQRLLETGRYTVGEIIAVLERLHHSGRGGSFSRDALYDAISQRHQRARSKEGRKRSRVVRRLPEEDWGEREVLIVGRGPLLHRHADAVNEYIARHRPIVIECNYLPDIEPSEDHYCAFVLLANARLLARAARASGKRVILGYAGSPVDLGTALDDELVFSEPYETQTGKLSFENGCVIPHDVVSMFGIGQAVRRGVRRISVVGFDGYAISANQREQRMQNEMKEFFALLQSEYPDVTVKSLLKTNYPIAQESIYALLAAP